MKLSFIVCVALAGCGAGTPSRQHVELGKLSFDGPGDWTHSESKRRGMVTSEWTPAEDNDRRESVTVIRSELSPAVAAAGIPAIESLLASAQGSLHDARLSSVTTVRTTNGLAGVRLEVDYVPPDLHARYRRVHVVLVDGSALLHVLYTAKNPDAKLDAFNLVLTTIRHEES